jgi:hypothetical protein
VNLFRERYRGIYPGDNAGKFIFHFGKIIPVWGKIPNRILLSRLPRWAPHTQFQKEFPEIQIQIFHLVFLVLRICLAEAKA